MIRSVIITADLPPGVTITEWLDYVQEWVSCGRGSLPPEAPLFNLDPKTVHVRLIQERRLPKR
jgi:hypothetical protein